MPVLKTADVKSRLKSLPGWRYSKKSLVRKFTFKDFRDAIAFITRLAFDAEAADHHPDLLVNYKRVTVTWSTHDEGGVTAKDFSGVGHTNAIAKRLGGE